MKKQDEYLPEPTLTTPDGRRRSRAVARARVYSHNYQRILFVQLSTPPLLPTRLGVQDLLTLSRLITHSVLP